MAKDGMPRVIPNLSAPDVVAEPDFEYAWRWSDKDDDSNRVFNARMSEEDIKAWCRQQEQGIAPVTLVKRPREPWVEVDFR